MMDDRYDVVVIGAGPQGLMAASWIKKERPALRVAVLDRSEWAAHKIGESTLSGFCRAARSLGLRHEVFRQLFYTKNGLGFWWADSDEVSLEESPEYITETFDETFQVERRVLDSLLEANAKEHGVEVIRGAKVQASDSTFSSNGNHIVYSADNERHAIEARVVMDASGPNSVLGRHLSGYTTAEVPFQTSSTWAYFKDIKWLDDYGDWRYKSEFPRDEYTQHICFKEGWLWYIPIVSWENSSNENLNNMLAYLANPENPVLSKDELAEQFNCVYEQIWSIGITLRSDRDQVMQHGAQHVFDHYRKKVPAIGKMLEGAEILEDHYKSHSPYAGRMKFRRHAKQVAGDGWLLIGDAAFFVDPLRSPGLTGGAATTYYAVQEVLKALDQGNTTRRQFSSFEAFASELYEIVEEQNQIAYMSHNHPDAISIVRRFGEISSRSHFNAIEDLDYSLLDTNIWGHFYPEHRKRQRQIWQIMREEEVEVGHRIPVAEQTSKDYERMVQRLQEAIGDYLDKNVELTPYIKNNLETHNNLARGTQPIVAWMHPAAQSSDMKASQYEPGVLGEVGSSIRHD